MNLKPTILKEEIANYPLAEFTGTIYVVQTPEEADKAVEFLKKQEIIGFDTETRPTFKKGNINNISLIQLSTENICFLFRINKIGITKSVKDLLTLTSVKKIGLSLKDDFRGLRKITDLTPVNFVDLQQYVKNFKIEENSLMKIYAIIFEKKISKTQRLTNWEADFLTEKQKRYAALDAWAAREIYVKLQTM